MMNLFRPLQSADETVPEEARSLPAGFHLHLAREVNTSAERAWEVLAGEYTDITPWSKSTARCWEMTDEDLDGTLEPDPRAPVIGRLLESGRFGVIGEVLVMFDAEGRRFRFATSGLPWMLSYAGNTQSVTALGDNRCKVSFDIYVVPWGPVRLLKSTLKSTFIRGLGRSLDEVARYIETGVSVSEEQ